MVAVSCSETDRFVLHLLIAENDEVGGLEFPVVPDFLHDVVVGVIEFDANARLTQGFSNPTGVVGVLFTDGDDMALCWRKPGWETPGKVFDEHAAKPLHGAERGAMNHHRPVKFAISTFVGQVEPLGKVVIHLNGAKLPFSADHVFDHKVNFWTVKRGFAFFL